ncbi:MAG: polysaccharide deacetylase family protein [Chloroflexi bacterium]|nr:polysaccharide deacetylase family protein [Chloroflexota bacterium]MDL1883532.1 polysaccharide deacetylase family protein [Anaerolineae bacterium CFX8]
MIHKWIVTAMVVVLASIGGGSHVLPVLADTQRSEPAWDGTLRRVRVPVLMYHYVSSLPPDADDIRRELTVTPDLFRAHLAYLKEQGYSTISFYDLDAALLTGSPLPSRPVILTFDDGYIDHYVNVLPALRDYGFTGTFFIITALADANRGDYLNWAQIREMADAGMSMESHTKNHVDLRGRDYDFLVYELLGSLESLAVYTGRTSHILSYPVGHYDAMTLQVVEQLPIWRAVTTQRGALHTTDNRLEMPRVRVHGGTGPGGLASLLNAN